MTSGPQLPTIASPVPTEAIQQAKGLQVPYSVRVAYYLGCATLTALLIFSISFVLQHFKGESRGLTIVSCFCGLMPAMIYMYHWLLVIFVRLPACRIQLNLTFDKNTDTIVRKSIAEQFNKQVTEMFGMRYEDIVKYIALTLALATAGMATIVTLLSIEHISIDKNDFPKAAQLGILGAFVYISAALGRRFFQRDITTALGMWCIVQIVIGPILATLLCLTVMPNEDEPHASTLTTYFLAGMLPRNLIGWLVEIGQRIWSGDAKMNRRLIALSEIRGITVAVEDRLAEEGIEDVNMLAMCDPLRLIRNTSFDPRVIVSWIDEAILISTLPNHWKQLEQHGITGAIDLAWQFQRDYEKVGVKDNSAILPILSKKIGLEQESLLTAVAHRLSQDSQVECVWCIYLTSATADQKKEN